MLTRRGVLKATVATAASALWIPRAGLAQVAPGPVKRGGTLTAAIFADPLTFDPHFTGNLQGRAATRAIHDTRGPPGAGVGAAREPLAPAAPAARAVVASCRGALHST
jgi:ABC-type transport system substrate-binding protein